MCVCVAYQKILSWEPLIELGKLNYTDESTPPFTLGDVVAMEMVIRYSGPKVSFFSSFAVKNSLAIG